MSKEVTLSSGVVVRLNAVSPMLVLAVSNSIPVPKPPILRNEEKQRDEPNELDPDYLERVERRQLDLTRLTTEAYVANGVQVLENLLPSGKFALASDEWVERVELVLGQDKVRKTGIGRTVDWIQYHLLESAEDLTALLSGVAEIGGLVKETDVEAAVESFRPNENGAVPAGSEAEAELRQRDTPTDNVAWPDFSNGSQTGVHIQQP